MGDDVSELERALRRPDAERMCRHLDACARDRGRRGRSREAAAAFDDIVDCYRDDPEKAFAYVILGAARSDSPELLSLLGCGPLEDILRAPSVELLDRIVAEARRSARFRWLLSNPFQVAVAPAAWAAIALYRIVGPHEEPAAGDIPPRT